MIYLLTKYRVMLLGLCLANKTGDLEKKNACYAFKMIESLKSNLQGQNCTHSLKGHMPAKGSNTPANIKAHMPAKGAICQLKGPYAS